MTIFIIYIIQSILHPDKIYIGFTKDLSKRLQAHNAMKSLFSKRYAPWELVCHINLKDEKKAKEFEKYLKRGSEFAFLKKHLLPMKKTPL